MNIAVNARFLLKDKLEGIGKFSLEVLSRIVERHPEHRFYFLFDRPYAPEFVFAPNVVPVVLFPPARHPLLMYVWYEVRVAHFLRTHEIDLFLSTDGKTCLSTRVPTLTVMHDLAFEHFPGHLALTDRWYLRHYSPKFARHSTRLVAVSAFTRQDLAAQYQIDPQKVDIVYNAASAHFRPTAAAEQQAFRERFTRKQEFFLYVGAIHPRKNLERVLQAFDQFKAVAQQPVKLLIVGRKAWKTGHLQETFEGMHYPDDVVFSGRLSDEDLRQAYGAAMALVYVPLFEGFGIPVLEAQRCNCPVITSSVSSLPEVVGEAGIKVPPTSVPAIAAALTRMAGEKKLRQHLALAGQENAARFCWDRSAHDMWQAILHTVEAAKAPRS